MSKLELYIFWKLIPDFVISYVNERGRIFVADRIFREGVNVRWGVVARGLYMLEIRKVIRVVNSDLVYVGEMKKYNLNNLKVELLLEGYPKYVSKPVSYQEFMKAFDRFGLLYYRKFLEGLYYNYAKCITSWELALGLEHCFFVNRNLFDGNDFKKKIMVIRNSIIALAYKNYSLFHDFYTLDEDSNFPYLNWRDDES